MKTTDRTLILAFFAAGWMRYRWKATGPRLQKANQRYLQANHRFLRSAYHNPLWDGAAADASAAVRKSEDAAWECASKAMHR